jgi:hypothetical protein
MTRQIVLFHDTGRSLTHYRHFCITDRSLTNYRHFCITDRSLTTVTSALRTDHLLTTVTSALRTTTHIRHFHVTGKTLITSITSTIHKTTHIHHLFTSHCFKINNFLLIYSPILTKRTHWHKTNATFHIHLAIWWRLEEGNSLVSFLSLVVCCLGTQMSAVSHERNQMIVVNT